MNYLILAGAWAMYLTLHSILASNYIKHQFDKNLGICGKSYRFFYSIISTIGVAFLGLLIWTLPGSVLFDYLILQVIGVLIAVGGLVVLWYTFRFFSTVEFLGLKNANSEDQLVTKGIHAKVRHPIYTGTIMLLLGYFLYIPTDNMLITLVVIFLYLPIGIHFEEKKLILKFGQDYLEYKRRVPSIVPKLGS